MLEKKKAPNIIISYVCVHDMRVMPGCSLGADGHCVILSIRVRSANYIIDVRSFKRIGEAEHVDIVSEWRLGLGGCRF